MAGPKNLFEYLDGTLTSPLFLAGAGLASGEGFGGAMQGMKMGLGAQEARREQAQRQQLTQLLGDSSKFQGVPPEIMALAQATRDPSGINSFLTKKYDPMTGLDRQLAEAKIRHLSTGGAAPANVREWQYFNNLPQEQRQEYLTLRRAQPWLNTGTEFVQPSAVNPTQQNAAIPIDTAGKKRAEAIGEAGGKAAADLPRVIDNASQTLDLIEGIKRHPGTARNFGVQGKLWNMPGGQAADAWSRIEQLGGKAFLEAFNSLKGGGQITEVEGQKATNAIVAMNNAQSYESFIQALNDFESVIRAGVARARGNAGLGGSGADAGAPQRLRYNPQTGELE